MKFAWYWTEGFRRVSFMHRRSLNGWSINFGPLMLVCYDEAKWAATEGFHI